MLVKIKSQLFLFLAFLLWFGSGVVLSQLNFFKAQEIGCQLTNNQACPDNLLTKIQVVKNRSLFFGDFRKVFANDQQLTTTFKIKNVKKYLPDRVEIFFEPIKLSYLLEDGDKTYLVTDLAVAIDNQPATTKLPKVSLGQGEQRFTIKDDSLIKVENKFHAEIMNIIEALTTQQLDFDQVVYFFSHEIKVVLTNQIEAIMDADQAEVNASRLKLIVNNKQLEELDLSTLTVDVRFSLPVLRNQE